MENKSENIFLLARIQAGYKTRADAAERLNISYDSLADYETGITVPSEDMVFEMAEAYQNQMLIVENFLQTRTGKFLKEKFGIDYELGELSRATLGFINGHKRIDIDRLVSVVYDGVISPEELPDAQYVESSVRMLTEYSFRLLWALQNAANHQARQVRTAETIPKRIPRKTKTVLPDGHRRKLSCVG